MQLHTYMNDWFVIKKPVGTLQVFLLFWEIGAQGHYSIPFPPTLAKPTDLLFICYSCNLVAPGPLLHLCFLYHFIIGVLCYPALQWKVGFPSNTTHMQTKFINQGTTEDRSKHTVYTDKLSDRAAPFAGDGLKQACLHPLNYSLEGPDKWFAG